MLTGNKIMLRTEFINKIEDTQFLFELGNVLINFMIDFKLLKF